MTHAFAKRADAELKRARRACRITRYMGTSMPPLGIVFKPEAAVASLMLVGDHDAARRFLKHLQTDRPCGFCLAGGSRAWHKRAENS